MSSRSRSRRRGAFSLVSLGVLGAFGVSCAEPTTSVPADRGSGPFQGGGVGGTGPVIDFRAVVTAPRTPPPISGGTLISLREAGRAVVADPDRDRVVVVDTRAFIKRGEVALEAGAEPGRLVEDATGRVHVVLRGTGEILTVDPNTATVVERRSVCRAPRGIAFDAAGDALVVACLEGNLVELPASGGEAFRTTALGPDLRDVVFLETGLAVTRFRSAEIIFLDGERNVTNRVTPLSNDASFAATTAWRAVPAPSGGIFVAHQRSLDTSIDISGNVAGGGTGGTAGTAAGAVGGNGTGVASGYGSSFDPCASIVQGTTTTATATDPAVTHQTLPGIALPVDVAIAPGGLIAVANGAFDPTAPTVRGAMGFVVVHQSTLTSIPGDCGTELITASFGLTATSVVFDTEGRLLVQTRQPSQLWVHDETFSARVVDLGGSDVTDTGHDMFHADSGSGIACASCHAEGTDDGHVWNFVGLGSRRTQALDVGLEGSAPFHWDGELASFEALVHEVFQRRMGGPHEPPERIAALEHYVYGLKRRPAVRAVGDESVARGKILFESMEVGCSGCHSGPKFTTGETKLIGKGAGTQVPSLIGVSARAPLMHDGCAATLRERFDPACGGTDHGHPELLDDVGLADLIAYLETL